MQFLYWVLKNSVLQTLKVSINHWNEQRSLVNVCSRTSACLDMGDFHVTLQQWRTEGGGFKPPPPNSEGPTKNRAKLNPIVNTVKKNCWI